MSIYPAFILVIVGIAAALAGLSQCAPHSAHAFSGSAPSPSPSAISNAPKTSESASPSVSSIVAASSCSSFSWPSREKMPLATLEGFAETLQKSYCAKRPILTQAVGSASVDGFAVYTKEQPTLPNLYALLLDSAMMESSGNVCEGRDTSAGAETASEAESGLLQQSANVEALNPALAAIVTEYQAHPERCGFSTFRAKPCPTGGIVGTGSGADFQRLMLSCPALAIEQAALGFRVGVRHWGPARRGELTFNQACSDMFSAIAKVTVCQ